MMLTQGQFEALVRRHVPEKKRGPVLFYVEALRLVLSQQREEVTSIREALAQCEKHREELSASVERAKRTAPLTREEWIAVEREARARDREEKAYQKKAERKAKKARKAARRR